MPIGGPEVGFKIRRGGGGGSGNVEGIVCPLVGIGLTDLPKIVGAQLTSLSCGLNILVVE